MPLDPEIAHILEPLRGRPGMETMSLAELRASMVPLTLESRTSVASVDDITVAQGLPGRLYVPNRQRSNRLLLFFHGGGFVLGSIETHDHVARDLCDACGCRVLSADYRLAPEFRFPTASHDCLSIWLWITDNAAALGVEPSDVIIAGDSAGGNLALVTALRLRDAGLPGPAGLILGYPVTDYHTPPTASYIENAEGYSLTRAAMIRFWDDYLENPAQATLPYAAPLRSETFSGLPPALVMTAQFDPLRDEGAALAAGMERDGVPVTYICYEGLIHGFLRMALASARARQAFATIGEWISSLDD